MKDNAKAVIFGAGKVACGLLGPLLYQSGYKNLFIARRPAVIDAIQCHQGYSVNVLNGGTHRLMVRDCAALPMKDQSAVVEAVSHADVVFTAVGIDNLTAIAPSIAEGLWRRSLAYAPTPLNVIACENLPGAGAYLRHQIVGVAPAEKAMVVENVGGFSAALTRQIMTGGNVEEGKISFSVEGDPDLIIDTHGLRDPLPELERAKFTRDFSATVMRKLFTLNCAQAVAAYLGYREGCRYMHEAVVHSRIAPVLKGAIAEAQTALKAEFPDQARAIDEDVAEALSRIADVRLADPVTRVARGPRRKLSPRERLVGPARLASHHNLPNKNLCIAIAAALTYDCSEDPEAVALQRAIAAEGLEKPLTEDCGLLPHEELARAVKQQWHQLKAGRIQAGALINGTFSTGNASLEKIMHSVAVELSQLYNPELVREVVTRAAERFQDARVWSFVPILLKKEASEKLVASGEGVEVRM